MDDSKRELDLIKLSRSLQVQDEAERSLLSNQHRKENVLASHKAEQLKMDF